MNMEMGGTALVMLEFISTKVVVSIAALVILASIGGFMYLQKETIREQALNSAVNEFVSIVDSVSRVDSELSLIMTFSEDGKGVHLRDLVDDKRYSLKIFKGRAIATQDGISSSAEFSEDVHLFCPAELKKIAASDLQILDLAHQQFETQSNGEIFIENRLIDLDDRDSYLTFLYKV
jgi:hypothetical protein